MNDITRRGFLAGMAAASTLAVPRKSLAANDKLNIAGIGIGSMGGSNIRNLAHAGENIVALCDVDSVYAAKVFRQFPDAKQYTDYRVMLDEMPEIDAVVIGTPDHTHAVISVAAMRAGKHVFCQKPLTHTVYEARRVAEVARETGVVTQMGIQGHSGDGARSIREWIQAGVIGDVTEVDAWCSLSYYPWGHASWSSPLYERPEETPAVPDTLDWDLWIGPAPMRPYHPTYHPTTWRAWYDFGCGMMGDRGVHTFDPVVWALDLGAPVRVEASSMGSNDEVHPIASVVRFTFPGDPPVIINWYEGFEPPKPPDLDGAEEIGHPEGGMLFKGTKGYITGGVYGDNARLLPASRMESFTPPEPTLPRIDRHEEDWTDAIKNGRAAGADFAYSGPLTETVLLGNIAKRMSTRIEWDSAKLEVTNLPEANQYVHKEYRKGWSL